MSTDTVTASIDEGRALLAGGKPAAADRVLTAAEGRAFNAHDTAVLRDIWPSLAEARKARRVLAAAGRIDLHTHTTASDGALTVEESLAEHFVQGQILINDHNIIDSLAPARRIVREMDLALDVFLGIEVICTRERRAFEFMAIAPSLSDAFVELSARHRENWNRVCSRFVRDLRDKDDFFDDPLWMEVARCHEVRESFVPVTDFYREVQKHLRDSKAAFEKCLADNQTFAMGDLWQAWGADRTGDPPQFCHRFFGSMRCYAMNAYPDEVGDWFHYDRLARAFKDVGCVISHNHPNYWDDDFIGELPYALQEEWIREWAELGVIDALEVWSPPFASVRVPQYWGKVAAECRLIPMAGTDMHGGWEQEFGGTVENHPEIPPMLYEQLAAPLVAQAEATSDAWTALTAWRRVLDVDYAQERALASVVRLLSEL